MKTDYKIYKLLEIIEMPKNTNVHMINGKDYKINENGELESKDGDTLPISKQNIDNCEFTIIEKLKNYNFRVYKDDTLILCFNKIIGESSARILAKELYDAYQNKNEEECFFSRMCDCQKDQPLFYMPSHVIEVKIEEIIESL